MAWDRRISVHYIVRYKDKSSLVLVLVVLELLVLAALVWARTTVHGPDNAAPPARHEVVTMQNPPQLDRQQILRNFKT